MRKPLFFKAQALDNTSPDNYKRGTEWIDEANENVRTEITGSISDVARKGSVIWKDGGAELIVKRRNSPKRFLIQVYSEVLDQAGRRAPLLCCGEFDGLNTITEQVLAATIAIKDFAIEIGRSVDPNHARSFDSPALRNKLEKWEDSLKKKRRATQVAIGIGIVTFATLLAFAVMKQANPPTQTTQKQDARSTSGPASQR